MQRRDFLKSAAAGWVLFNTAPSLAAVNASSIEHKKIVWVVLRGAMDSLHAVVPTFDPDLLKHRKTLVNPIADSLLPLEKGFALHPAFKYLHSWYLNKQMMPIVAVASPYRQRSHFDAQDMLESGLAVTEHDNGWLGRAINQTTGDALAIARSVPISLRGNDKIHTWYPSNLPDAEDDLFARLEQLYEKDEMLAAKLAEGMQTRQSMEMGKSNKRNPKFAQLAKSCAELLVNNKDAYCAMLEMGGWDTHNNQLNRLNNQFTQLDDGLNILKQTLADEWKNTIVIVATEFGRTVAVNGTAGTDHGTGSAMFLAGGALSGGKVLGQWPGLASEQLYQNRDLQPTTDVRSWLAAILHQHWHFSAKQIAEVFPDVTPQTTQLVI